MMILGLTISFFAFAAVLLWWALPRLLRPPDGTSDWNI